MREIFSYFDNASGDGLAVTSDEGRLCIELSVDDRLATLVLTDRKVIARLARALHEDIINGNRVS